MTSWDEVYKTENVNYQANDDEGVIWFEESNAEDRIMKYIEDVLEVPKDTTTFLDVGTGNGHLLFTLHEDGGFEGKMMGVDYSERSVELAMAIADERGIEERNVEFRCVDVVRDDLTSRLGMEGGWDVVLDKGTFDAISLSAERLGDGRSLAEGYVERVAGAVKEGGWLLVTSCNWTEEELKEKMLGKGGLVYHGRIK